MSDAAPIQVTVVVKDAVAVVSPHGDIGTHEAPALRNAIRQAYDARPRTIIMDLSGVTYMATAGLATLVEALQLAKKQQVRLVLCGLHERVRAVFEISRLTAVFTIAGTLEEARTK